MDTTAPTSTLVLPVFKQPQSALLVNIKSEPEDFEDYEYGELHKNNVECKTEKEPGEGEGYAQAENGEEELCKEGVTDEKTGDEQSNGFDDVAAQQNTSNIGERKPIKIEPNVPLSKTCTLCKNFFENYQALREHKLLEHKSVQCSTCGVCVSGLDNLNKHCETVHTGQQRYKCNLCTATFACKSSCENHQRSHDLPVCFKCEHCQYFCSSLKLLSRHVHMAHQSEHDSEEYKPFNCMLCGASFKYDFTYEAHLKAHKSEEACGDFDLGGEAAKDFPQNCASRTNPVTKVVFLKLRSKPLHIASKIIDDDKVENKPVNFDKTVFRCPKCPSSYTTKRKHNIHMKTHWTPKQSTGLIKKRRPGRCIKKQTKRKFINRTSQSHSEKTIQCTICLENFESAFKLSEHDATRHRALQCGLCDRHFFGFNNMTTHFKAEHGRKPETNLSTSTSFERGLCGLCIKCFDGFKSLTRHLEADHKDKNFQKRYGCPKCTAIFAGMTSWENHQQTHKLQAEEGNVHLEHQEMNTEPFISFQKVYNKKRLHCSLCKDVFEHPRILFEHRQAEHTPVKCRHCQKHINGLANLKRHSEIEHEQETRYSCSHCPAMFVSKTNFETHLRAHVQIKTPKILFQCKHCLCPYATRNLLSRHLHNVHHVHLENECQPLVDEASAGNKNISVEGDGGNEKEHSGIKIAQVFSLSEKAHDDKKGEYCSVCYNCFENRSDLMEHQRTEHKPIVCVLCRKQVNGIDNLNNHFRLEHGTEPRFGCLKCSATFASRTECEIHKKSHAQTKLQSRGFKCKYCKSVYLTAHLLSQHVKTTHSSNQDSEDDKPFTCEVCGEAFNIALTYETHLKGHKPNAPQNCREELEASLGSFSKLGSEDGAEEVTCKRTKRIKLESDTD